MCRSSRDSPGTWSEAGPGEPRPRLPAPRPPLPRRLPAPCSVPTSRALPRASRSRGRVRSGRRRRGGKIEKGKKKKKRKSGKPTKKNNQKNKTKTTEAAGGGALPGAERGTGGRSPVRCVLSLRAARTRPAGGAAPALGLRAERLPPPNAPR